MKPPPPSRLGLLILTAAFVAWGLVVSYWLYSLIVVALDP